MARSMVPSPPMLTSRSARCRSSSADTGLALQASRDSSLSMPRTSIPRWSAQSSTEATAPPQSRSGCSINPTTCMPLRYSGQDEAVPAVPSGMNRPAAGAGPRGLVVGFRTTIV